MTNLTTHSQILTGLLIGAALLPATPSEARAGLLPVGTRPPVFALPDGAGVSVSLRPLLGTRRVVLLFGPSASYVETIRAQGAQFAERDLTVLAVVPHGGPHASGTHGGLTHVLADADGSVTREYGAGDGKAAFYLIGKDGHIALARHGYPTPHELFGIIDAMPMRRREMRERGR